MATARKAAGRTGATAPVRAKRAKPVSPVAARLAERMPFVHFPARQRMDDVTMWAVLRPASHAPGWRNDPTKPGLVFEQSHAFAYAGPCCFAESHHHGDVALYFEPSVDRAVSGDVCAFDSGALLHDTKPCVRRWASNSWAARRMRVDRASRPAHDWRPTFERWLSDSYDEPIRYLESTADKWSAGVPDRLSPSELLNHNGPRGRARYGEDCADRRAWTWEARFRDVVPLAALAAVHVAADHVRLASTAWPHLATDRIIPLDADAAPGRRAFYLESGDMLRALTR